MCIKAGKAHSVESTHVGLQKQLEISICGVKKPITDCQTNTGTKDKIVQMFIDELIGKMCKGHVNANGQQISPENIESMLRSWLAKHENNIINLSFTLPGFDPHTDTPIELLHTISLGIAKCIWHSSHTPWKKDQESTFAVCLQAANVDGLSIQPICANYIMCYANSLFGCQLKT